jgi:hypothetical protein
MLALKVLMKGAEQSTGCSEDGGKKNERCAADAFNCMFLLQLQAAAPDRWSC